MGSTPVEQVSKLDRQFVWQARLDEKPRAALGLCTFSEGPFCVRCEHDYRDVTRPRLFPQLLKEIPYVAVAQRGNRKDNVRVRLPGAPAGFRTAVYPHRLEPQSGEPRDIHLARVVVAIDDQNERAQR